MTTRIVPFTDGMKIGIGYNRLSGDRSPTLAVQGASVTTMQGGGGQLVTSDCITIKDIETLHKSLGISIDAGGCYMGFSANAKVDYANVRDCTCQSCECHRDPRCSGIHSRRSRVACNRH